MTKSTRIFSYFFPGTIIQIIASALLLVGFASATLGQTRAYVTNSLGNTVSVIDITTNTVVATVPVQGPGDVAVTPDGAFAYVTSANNTVSVIDTTTNTVVAVVPVGQAPQAIAITPNLGC